MTHTATTILDLLTEGFSPEEIAAHLVDLDVSRGEYEGCSSDLELAHADYVAQAQRMLSEVGGR